jgi:hypothetical protein
MSYCDSLPSQEQHLARLHALQQVMLLGQRGKNGRPAQANRHLQTPFHSIGKHIHERYSVKAYKVMELGKLQDINIEQCVRDSQRPLILARLWS